MRGDAYTPSLSSFASDMIIKTVIVLLTVALVACSGLEDPRQPVSSGMDHRAMMDDTEDHPPDVHFTDVQCLPGSQLVFDVKATVEEMKRLNHHFFDCPNPEPGVPCFFFKDVFYPVFAIKANGSDELVRYKGRYTFNIIGGGPYSRDNIRYFTEEEIILFNSFNDSALERSKETEVWTLQGLSDDSQTILNSEGVIEMTELSSQIRWICQRNTPCGDLTPRNQIDPHFFFVIEVSNVNADHECEHTVQFELHVHGLPQLPLRALFYVTISMINMMVLLAVYVVFECCRQRQQVHSTTEMDIVDEEEEEEHDDWWTRVEKVHSILLTLTEKPQFANMILFVVVMDTLVKIIQTFPSLFLTEGWLFSILDDIFLAIYLMEFFLKIAVLGYKYFLNPWNILDFTFVMMSVMEFTVTLLKSIGFFSRLQNATIFFTLKVLKGARSLRAFRSLKAMLKFKMLHIIFVTLVKSLQSIGSMFAIMMLFLNMFAVFFRTMYNESDPDRFGTIMSTIITLFQVLTQDDWKNIYITGTQTGTAHIMLLLVLFIIIEVVILLNIILAVLVDSLGGIIACRKTEVPKGEDIVNRHTSETGISIREVESQQQELQTPFTARHYNKRMTELMTEYLSTLATIEHVQYSVGSDIRLLEKLVEGSFSISRPLESESSVSGSQMSSKSQNREEKEEETGV